MHFQNTIAKSHNSHFGTFFLVVNFARTLSPIHPYGVNGKRWSPIKTTPKKCQNARTRRRWGPSPARISATSARARKAGWWTTLTFSALWTCTPSLSPTDIKLWLLTGPTRKASWPKSDPSFPRSPPST